MQREEILKRVRIEDEIGKRGLNLQKKGQELVCRCPFHEDNSPSFRVNVEKQLWFCDPCSKGGSVVDFIAMYDKKLPGIVLKELSDRFEVNGNESGSALTAGHGKLICAYDYTDESGKVLYQSLRYEPKTFRQRHMGIEGKWIWNMEGVQRVLYALPRILKSPQIWIVEGEKDADYLNTIGFAATCNVGGAQKWLAAYSDALKGKCVTICGDNDEPGKMHVEMVKKSLAGKVKSLKIVKVPERFKDVGEFIESFGENREEAGNQLTTLNEQAVEIMGGIEVEVYSMGEMEHRYKKFLENVKDQKFSFGCWLPTLGRKIRGLVPGELCTLLAETGVGKTAVLQNIAKAARPLKTLVFELELPDTLCFERFMQIENNISGYNVEKTFYEKRNLGWGGSDHIFVCPTSKQTPDTIEQIINQSELKIGQKPSLVMVDYVGLVSGKGDSRYERMSNVAESMKQVAKSTNTIIIMVSQVSRKKEDQGREIYLNDAKDSGSIENSSGLVLGMWKENPETLQIRILKNTKGSSGDLVTCNFHGETLTITERAYGRSNL